MAGKKGRSGRKPRNDGKKMRAVNLYIPMYEYDLSHINSDKPKFQWIPDAWFRQFKRIYGSRWQEKVRTGMFHMVKDYEDRNMWKCECRGQIKSTHFMHEGECPRCLFVPGEIERYKTVATARIHSSDEPIQKPLSLCPVCKNSLSLQLDIHGRKVMTCGSCK